MAFFDLENTISGTPARITFWGLLDGPMGPFPTLACFWHFEVAKMRTVSCSGPLSSARSCENDNSIMLWAFFEKQKWQK
jgi:hypothetical protein